MAHPVDIYVGAKLRARRLKLGMTQKMLAKASGITFQQVQKYERATNRISVSRLFEFASVLRVSLEYFFEGLGEIDGFQLAESASGFQHQTKTPYDEDAHELMDAYQKIKNPEIRDSVKTFVIGVSNGSAVV